MNFIALGIALVLLQIGTYNCRTIYIVPINSTGGCEGDFCLTLNQLADKMNYVNSSNLILDFISGHHFLDQDLSFSNFERIEIIGTGASIWLQESILSISKVRVSVLEHISFVSNSVKEIASLQVSSNSITMINCTTRKGNIRLVTNALQISSCFYSAQVLVIHSFHIDITFQGQINNSKFFQGVLKADITKQNNSEIYITNCTFNNSYYKSPVHISHIYILNCIFTNGIRWIQNIITVYDTHELHILYSNFSNIECSQQIVSTGYGDSVYIKGSTFANNSGRTNAINSFQKIAIIDCDFTENTFSQALFSFYQVNMIEMKNSRFLNNTVQNGNAIVSVTNSFYKVDNCLFMNNHKLEEPYFSDAIISIKDLEVEQHASVFKNTVFKRNFSPQIVDIIGAKLKLENTSFVSNKLSGNIITKIRGCIHSLNSKLEITRQVTISDNIGRALYAIQSQIYITSTGNTVISNNTASSGGGIILRESELHVQSAIEISNNRAQYFGGGIYAYQSEIDFQSKIGINDDDPSPYFYKKNHDNRLIINNTAGQSGGGVYAVASSIKFSRSYITVSSNTALVSGGGFYLQENSKIYLLKTTPDKDPTQYVHLIVSLNSAVYGGGIYVADNNTVGDLQCQKANYLAIDNNPSGASNCFIQTIRLYSPRYIEETFPNIWLLNNLAKFGSALYGGLLDRCTANPQSESLGKWNSLNGLQYFKTIVHMSRNSIISSDPVQVILCNRFKFSIRKGENFNVRVAAINQVGSPVNATIHSSVITESGIGRLKEGQAEQKIGNQCTELVYNVFSKDSSAKVELYAKGPCSNKGISRQTISVNFLPCTCPIGLQPSPSPIECECVCDQRLKPHKITNCSQEAGTVQLESNIWIGIANSTNGTGYIVHECPFDYCVDKPVNISLNSSQERDRQCAFNRSGVLCGECQQGLSLVLGTSNCKKCSHIYLLLLIPFALAGIVLIAFILFFNITIASGSIHGLIIYSNLLTVNYFTQPSALSVFVSWVNLDLGIETCFYKKMSSQEKVLLQLLFPAYLFLLMFLIIILCRYLNVFATLLSKRNPVAALCTLIFMSYSKLVQFTIAALQSTVLEFPDGTKQRIWQYDGNTNYFTSSRTPHFLAAAAIVTAGGLITLQLFFAQWFPHCSKWKFMKWTNNTKYSGFMDAFHAPFTHKHRYWVGLLLLSLVVHNIIASFTSETLPAILSMGCIATSLLTLKLSSKRVYKSWINNLLENAFLLNLIFLAFGTLYAQASEQIELILVLSRISMGISTCLFIIIICYHSYKHVYLKSRFYRRHKVDLKSIIATVKKSLGGVTGRQDMVELVTDQGDTLTTNYTEVRSQHQREPDLDMLAPITEKDYRPALFPTKAQTEVTHTVVEIKQ